MHILQIRKPSTWQFITSSSGGLGVDFFAAEGGSIYFRTPNGARDSFRYGAAGGGLTLGLKLPKIGKVQVSGHGVAGAIAPAAFPNTGKLYILETFKGSELAHEDIRGACAFVEVAGGLVVGGSATAMLIGMDPWLLAGAVSPLMLEFDYRLLRSATGLLVMGGVNVGVQAGGGVGAFLGGLW